MCNSNWTREHTKNKDENDDSADVEQATHVILTNGHNQIYFIFILPPHKTKPTFLTTNPQGMWQSCNYTTTMI